MRLRFSVLALAIAAACSFAAPAAAATGLTLCNRTSYVLYAATGAMRGGQTLTQGWTRIAPGSCVAALDKPLDPEALYFLYARSSQAHAGAPRAWGGATPLCVKDPGFSLHEAAGAGGCREADAFTVPFSELDVNGKTAWTATLTESAKIPTLETAQSAGLVRLLSDAGYRLGSGNGGVTVVDALKQFRARMKLPVNAPVSDLFDALETEALKLTAPEGYSICNDTEQTIYAAIGTKMGKDWESRGWWNVVPGACAHALTAPIARQKIYLLVAHRGKDPGTVVSGPAKFCITDIAFDVEGRERCAERGLREAGFAVTNTRGLPGYAAHVDEAGLLPAAPVVE